MQTQLLVLQIPDGPSAALPHWRITRPTVLTAVEQLRRTDTLDPRLVSTAEPSDLRHEIISNRHRDRRVAQPDVGRDAAKAGSVRIQPALTAGEQLGGGIDGADENTGTNTTTLRPTRGARSTTRPPPTRCPARRNLLSSAGAIRARRHEAGRHR